MSAGICPELSTYNLPPLQRPTIPVNDSQVIDIETILPQSDLLPIVNADHWAVASPVRERLLLIAKLYVNKNAFPRHVLLHAFLEHLAYVDQKIFPHSSFDKLPVDGPNHIRM